MPFRYLRDPVFLVAFVLYVINRVVFKKIWPSGFCHEHFNDLLCMPFWIPILLWLKKCLRLRSHDGPPTRSELLIPLVMWSLFFEVVVPESMWFRSYCTPDHRDVLWYAIGACIANVVWQFQHRPDNKLLEQEVPGA